MLDKVKEGTKAGLGFYLQKTGLEVLDMEVENDLAKDSFLNYVKINKQAVKQDSIDLASEKKVLKK